MGSFTTSFHRVFGMAPLTYRGAYPLATAQLRIPRCVALAFNDPPTRQPYGIDTSFRDPSGNNIRLTQVLEFDPNLA